MKEQHPYLPTISIPGQIVFVILAQLCSDYSKKILLNLTQFITLYRNRVKFRRICVESPKQNGTQKYLRDNLLHNARFWQVGLFQVFFFQNISTNPIISHDVITLELSCSGEVVTFLAFRFLLSALRYSCSFVSNSRKSR